MYKKWFLLLGIIFLFVSCNKSVHPALPQKEIVLGTICTVNLFEHGTQELYAEIFDTLQKVENLMSANTTTSEIACANKNAGLGEVVISKPTYDVLKIALEYSEKTNGAFNLAIGPLVKIWGIGTADAKIPTKEEIQVAKELCNWQNIVLSEKNDSYFVFLEKAGMSLDLGGVAKGYAADQINVILKSRGIDKAMIDLGGNIFAYGEKEINTPWRIGIKNPFDSTGEPIIALSIKNESVVTSGVYERFFEQDGIRYHHLINSATGFPSNNGLMSVTIVHEYSTVADILSTAVFILGKDDGMNLLENMGIQGFCIASNKEIYATNTIVRNLEIINKDFFLSPL